MTAARLNIGFLIRGDWQYKPGGDTVQLSLTRHELLQLSVESLVFSTPIEIELCSKAPTLLHVFNIDRPTDTHLLLDIAEKKWPGIPVVISTIHHREQWVADILRVSPVIRDRAIVVLQGILGGRAVDSARALFRQGGSTFGDRFKLALATLKMDLMIQKKKLLERADAVIALGDAEVRWLEEDFGFDRKKKATHIVPNGFDLFHSFEPTPNSDREGIIQISRIEPRKNQLKLAKLAKENRLRITFIGAINENFGGYAQAFLKEVRANPHARWLGQIPRVELSNILRMHRVHVLPSQAEVLPLVDFEALVSGCAVLTTQRSCSAEYLTKLPIDCAWGVFDPNLLNMDLIEKFMQKHPKPLDLSQSFDAVLPSWNKVVADIHQIYLNLT